MSCLPSVAAAPPYYRRPLPCRAAFIYSHTLFAFCSTEFALMRSEPSRRVPRNGLAGPENRPASAPQQPRWARTSAREVGCYSSSLRPIRRSSLAPSACASFGGLITRMPRSDRSSSQTLSAVHLRVCSKELHTLKNVMPNALVPLSLSYSTTTRKRRDPVPPQEIADLLPGCLSPRPSPGATQREMRAAPARALSPRPTTTTAASPCRLHAVLRPPHED